MSSPVPSRIKVWPAIPTLIRLGGTSAKDRWRYTRTKLQAGLSGVSVSSTIPANCSLTYAAYDKEDCFDDVGWCFKAAVGKSLPSTFFSYGQAPPADPSRIPALSDMVSEMGSPSYDMTSTSNETTSAPTATASPEIGLFPIRRRSRLRPDRRSRPRRVTSATRVSRKRDELSQLPVDPSQRAISKGYSDGFLTAKIFALYDMSKLGFTGQYINDSIAKLGGNVIQPGMEHYYGQWFMEGLNDGEALISSYVNGSRV